MTRLLTTTALVAMLGTTSFADNHSSAFLDYTVTTESDLFASELIGMRVYVAENEMDQTMPATDAVQAEWDDIGEINEIVVTREGDVAAVIVGVGGFLGVGERDVAINMGELSFMREEGESDDFFLVVQSSREALENAPAFQSARMTESGTDANEVGRTMLTPPQVEREGYAIAEREQLTTEALTGARVYGGNDEDIGEVSEILISDSGQIEEVVIDVGGFLGIGEHPVAVTFDELTILRNADGDEFRVYIDANQEMLEKQPAYEG
ncbi:MAG: PRC-barrel domain-containing protein [Pseudomonadota bacterium]